MLFVSAAGKIKKFLLFIQAISQRERDKEKCFSSRYFGFDSYFLISRVLLCVDSMFFLICPFVNFAELLMVIRAELLERQFNDRTSNASRNQQSREPWERRQNHWNEKTVRVKLINSFGGKCLNAMKGINYLIMPYRESHTDLPRESPIPSTMSCCVSKQR